MNCSLSSVMYDFCSLLISTGSLATDTASSASAMLISAAEAIGAKGRPASRARCVVVEVAGQAIGCYRRLHSIRVRVSHPQKHNFILLVSYIEHRRYYICI